MKVNRSLIQEIYNNGELKQFSVFLYLKGLYSNSCIYDYSQISLSAKSGLPRSKVGKYISFFLKNGWAERHGNNIVFKKVRTLVENKNTKKRIPVVISGDTLKDIMDCLRLELIRQKAEQAKWYTKICHDLKKLGGKKQRKLEKRVYKKYTHFRDKEWNIGESGDLNVFVVSFKKLADWLDCSVGAVHQLIKRLKSKGMIIVKSGELFVKKICNEAEIDYLRKYYPKGFINSKGEFVSIGCNKYVF